MAVAVLAIATVAGLSAGGAASGSPGSATAAAVKGKAKLKPVGFKPLSSKAAAKRVRRNGFEPRPQNGPENSAVPSAQEVSSWRQAADMPYEDLVNGRFRGTTDEIIQWTAHKWGLPEDVVRADAVVESYWDMEALGDNGDSFGLFQNRRPFHCDGDCSIFRDYTAMNADYFGGWIRAIFDGKMTWLNDVEQGRPYKAGDLWGSLGVHFSGRWYTEDALGYIDKVRGVLRDRTWEDPDF